MASYVVIKTINGRQYRYLQETWREGGRMRTRSKYLGPVGGDAPSAAGVDADANNPMATARGSLIEPIPRRRRRGVVTELLRDVVRKRDRTEAIEESEAAIRERVGREDRERARHARANELLTAPTISLEALNEIADMQAGGQKEGESKDSPNDAGEASAE